MIFVAVNFHYVADAPSDQPRAVFPVTPAELEAQIRALTATFEPISRAQLVEAVATGAALPERACMFTFDDGLREQFELALPVFDRLDCPVVFFVPGRPLAEGRALNVHRVHRLREELDDEEVLALLEPHLDGVVPDAVDGDAATGMYRYDTPDAARIKYLLNVSLGPARSDEIVAAVFRERFGDEGDFVRELYMSPAQVAELERRELLGAHAYSHVPLARLRPDELRREFADNLAALERAAGRRSPIVSYPYGGVDAVDATVAEAAAAAGFVAGFTMERALNRTLERPLLLARIDCVDAPGGRRPLFDAEDPLAAGAGIDPARTRYFEETSATSDMNARA